MIHQRYRLLGLLGEGAMGQIHLAQENDLLRQVAFKTLHRNIAQNPVALGRFLNEVQITAQLDHPNIVPIYSLEVASDGLAYAMKLVQGKTLKDLIQETKTSYIQKQSPDAEHSLEKLLEYFLKVCEAMHYAHCKGIIHRDLKPANIMIGMYQEVYVMDWGIARLMGAAGQDIEGRVELQRPEGYEDTDIDMTQSGQILGTPRYMSPEQVQGRNNELDGRSDLFSLGDILFELVTLKPAFTGKDQIDLLKNVLKGHQSSLKHISSKIKIHKALQAIIRKATSRQRDQRYETVADFASDLRRFLRREAVSAHQETVIERGLRWLNRYRQWVLGIILGIMVLSTSVTLVVMMQQQNALEQAHRREQKLNLFLTDVFAQSKKIDQYFLQVEKTLEGFGAVVSSYLTRGLPTDEPYYLHNHFNPPDLAQSTYYNGPISLDWAITIPATHLKVKDLEYRIRQLNPLKRYFRRMLLNSETGGKPAMNAKEERYMIAEKGVPVMWGTTVLREGLAHWYPGKDLKVQKYDPRTRPYYTSAAYKHGKYWGTPYIDGTGSGMLLSCSMGLFSNPSQFLGTASLDLKIDYIITHLLNMPEKPFVSKTYLVNAQGHILVYSGHKGLKFAAKVHPDIHLPLFPYAPVVAAIRAKQSGYTEMRTPQRRILFTYARINTVGWYFVTASDPEQLFTSTTANH